MKIIKVDLKDIEQNENSRVVYKEADLSELMHSLKLNGLLQPVGVAKLPSGKYEAVFGNRRILAAKKLGWADIDAHVVSAETENDRDILNLIENLKRQNTTVSEDGRIFQALLDRGLTKEEVAVRLGISVQRVELALEVFNTVPKEFHKSIINRVSGVKPKGKISATSAHAILNMRKTYRLNRRQTRALMQFASEDDTSVNHLQHVAPLLKEGFSVGDAIKSVSKMVRVVMYVYIDEKKIQKLEKQHKTSITSILWEQLEKNSELGVHRMAADKALKFQAKRSTFNRGGKIREEQERDRA
jgi:ParB/RepB/Spo0J family partition protein